MATPVCVAEMGTTACQGNKVRPEEMEPMVYQDCQDLREMQDYQAEMVCQELMESPPRETRESLACRVCQDWMASLDPRDNQVWKA